MCASSSKCAGMENALYFTGGMKVSHLEIDKKNPNHHQNAWPNLPR